MDIRDNSFVKSCEDFKEPFNKFRSLRIVYFAAVTDFNLIESLHLLELEKRGQKHFVLG